jgi:hypothetical protein
MRLPLLDDIRCVESGSRPRVEAQFHHAPEPVATLLEERSQRQAAAAAKLLDRFVRIVGRLILEGPHTLISARRPGSGTGKMESGSPRARSGFGAP